MAALEQCLGGNSAAGENTPTRATSRGMISMDEWLSAWRRLLAAKKGSVVPQQSAPAAAAAGQDDEETGPPQFLRVGRWDVLLRVTRAPPFAFLGDFDTHEAAVCQLCRGPRRLSARPLIAECEMRSGRVWEVRAELIDTLEPAGHFLLLPGAMSGAGGAISVEPRCQRLLSVDCADLVEIGRSAGRRLCVMFDGLCAGASHNHLHAHAFALDPAASPLPIVLASGVAATSRVLFDCVEACALHWPAACIRVRGGSSDQCGRVISAICAQADACNLVVLGFSAYVFLRSADGEQCDGLPGALLLRAHHMVGRFIVHSDQQLAACAEEGVGAARIEECLRRTRGAAEGKATVTEEPAGELLARLFEYGGKLMFN
jgi:hypothetical protein